MGFEALSGGIKGRCNYEEKRIFINEGMDLSLIHIYRSAFPHKKYLREIPHADTQHQKALEHEMCIRDSRQGYRSGHYDRNLTTASGDVTLHVPRLKGVSFETCLLYTSSLYEKR